MGAVGPDGRRDTRGARFTRGLCLVCLQTGEGQGACGLGSYRQRERISVVIGDGCDVCRVYIGRTFVYINIITV